MNRLRLRPPRALRRGYTLVELMMALALLAVAVVGIISMQKITVTSNAHAKNLAMAQRIAQAWAGQLQLDATTWRTGLGGFLNSNATWQRPDYVASRNFGAAFDALGNPLSDSASDLGRARFCSHLRLSWLYPDTMNTGGNGVLRAEIRVFWQRTGESTVANAAFCGRPQDTTRVGLIGQATDLYHFVYQTVGVRQHSRI